MVMFHVIRLLKSAGVSMNTFLKKLLEKITNISRRQKLNKSRALSGNLSCAPTKVSETTLNDINRSLPSCSSCKREKSEMRGRAKRRSAGVALFKSVSLWYSRSARTRIRTRNGMRVDGTVPGRTGHTPATSSAAYSNIKKPPHFSKEEIESLTLIYERLIGAGKCTASSHHPPMSTAPLLHIKAKEGLERSVFRDLLHNTFNICAEDILMERIFCVFDSSSDGLVKLEEWLQGMSVFLKGTLEEKMLFAFNVYDLNSDGYIVREEIFTLLRNSLVKQPQDEDPEEGVKELVELVLKKLDRDKDGRLSLKDFRDSVTEEPLFLEAFGPCLPSDDATTAFLATLS